MEIVIEIPDGVLECLEAYVNSALRPVATPTGSVQMVRMYDSVENFIAEQVGAIVRGVIRQYPNAAVRSHLEQISQAEAAIERMVKVRAERRGRQGAF